MKAKERSSRIKRFQIGETPFGMVRAKGFEPLTF
jgi:hypothetical protein